MIPEEEERSRSMITLTVLCQDGEKKEIEDVIPQSNDKKWCAQNSLFTVDGISVFIRNRK